LIERLVKTADNPESGHRDATAAIRALRSVSNNQPGKHRDVDQGDRVRGA
jgi:hypothetical protein